MDKLKKGLVGSILISVILAVTLTYVWATTPTTTFYISTGVYPGAPSYTIWTEGSGASKAYYAKRYDGYIPTLSGDTNATNMINTLFATATGIIKFSGTFNLSGSIFPMDNQILDLYEATLTQGKIGSSFVTPILVASVSNVSIFGGRISPAKSGVQSYGIQIYQSGILHGTDRVENVTVRDVTIINSYWAGIGLLNASYCTITNNVIIDPGNTVDSLGPGILLDGSSTHNVISENRVKNSGEHGIKTYPDATDNIFSGNIIEDTGKCGIAIEGDRNIIDANIVSYANWTSIYTHGNQSIISNNIIFKANPHGQDAFGILGYSNNIITGNSIYTAAYGIQAIDNDTVTGNRLYNVTYSSLQLVGSYNTLTGNFAEGLLASTRGVKLETDSRANTITGETYIRCFYGTQEVGSTDFNIYIGLNTRDCTVGIVVLGGNSHVNHCWNGTTWVA